MPNWCLNRLVLTGPEDVIQEIVDSKLELQKLFPCPDLTKWYEWNVANWGTKWDIGPINNLSYEKIDKEYVIDITFDSAWSPPVEAMKKLFDLYQKRGLNLEMEYFEPGCAFLGKCSTTDGDFDDQYFDYSSLKELKKYVKMLNHDLALNEIDYMEESAKELAEFEKEEKKKTIKKPAVKKAIKKVAVKKVPKKKAIKKTIKK